MVQIEFEEPQNLSQNNYTMGATNVCGYNMLKIESLGDGDSTVQYRWGSSVSTSVPGSITRVCNGPYMRSQSCYILVNVASLSLDDVDITDDFKENICNVCESFETHGYTGRMSEMMLLIEMGMKDLKLDT